MIFKIVYTFLVFAVWFAIIGAFAINGLLGVCSYILGGLIFMTYVCYSYGIKNKKILGIAFAFWIFILTFFWILTIRVGEEYDVD